MIILTIWKKVILFYDSLSLEVISGGTHGSQGPVKVLRILFPRFLLKGRSSWQLLPGDTTESRWGATGVWRPALPGNPRAPRGQRPRPGRRRAPAGGAGIPAPGAQLGRSRSGLEAPLPFWSLPPSPPRPSAPFTPRTRSVALAPGPLRARPWLLAPRWSGARPAGGLGRRPEPAWGWAAVGWVGGGARGGARPGPRSPALRARSRRWSRLQRARSACTQRAGGCGLRAPRPTRSRALGPDYKSGEGTSCQSAGRKTPSAVPVTVLGDSPGSPALSFVGPWRMSAAGHSRNFPVVPVCGILNVVCSKTAEPSL